MERARKMVDIIIGSIPVCWDLPPIAPAQLKSFVEAEGFTCKVVDWNRDIRSKLNEDHYLFDHQTSNQIFMSDSLIDDEVRNVMMGWVDDLKKIESRYIGISCFGLEKNKVILFELLKMIKKQIPERPIILGGSGVPLDSIGAEAKDIRLIDYYVVGEGEHPLINILKGNFNYPGINGLEPESIKDLNELPPPDYSDLEITSYSKKELFIENSRGCPMKCKFCYRPLKHFIYRDGNVAAENVRYLYKKHNHKVFRLSDYLMTGNVKQLREFCRALILLRQKGEMERVKLIGFFTIRKQSLMPAEDYVLMQNAGFHILSIGVESGSEKVRYSMGKRFSNSDLDFTIEQCVKNEINLRFLFMVGYPTETEDDFQETIDFIKRHRHINEHINVLVSMGNPYIISLKRGSLEDVYDDPNIETDEYGNWIDEDNTYPARASRWFRLRDVVIESGYNIFDRSINTIKTKMKDYE